MHDDSGHDGLFLAGDSLWSLLRVVDMGGGNGHPLMRRKRLHSRRRIDAKGRDEAARADLMFVAATIHDVLRTLPSLCHAGGLGLVTVFVERTTVASTPQRGSKFLAPGALSIFAVTT